MHKVERRREKESDTKVRISVSDGCKTNLPFTRRRLDFWVNIVPDLHRKIINVNEAMVVTKTKVI